MGIDENGVTPCSELCRAVFELGFKAWSCCSPSHDVAQQGIREGLRAIDNAFPVHPTMANNLNLTKSPGLWGAKGASFWDGSSSSDPTSSHLSCARGLPGIAPQKHSFPVTKSKAANLRLRQYSENGVISSLEGQGDHTTILVLAWSYILSTRWAELLPGTNNITYQDVSAESSQHGTTAATVPIKATSGEAARWWQAVLAPGQGWLATVDAHGRRLYSPWSIDLSSTSILKPVFLESSPVSATAPTAVTAMHYLSKYVGMYGVGDQSRAALSAVLCLPFAIHWCSKITLPVPSITTRVPISEHDEHPSLLSLEQMDKLMVLSCNTRGLEAVLLSSFYDPSVPCNLVSPFLQGTFAALDNVLGDPMPLMLALLQRSPRVGFLWVGAMVLGAHLPLLEKARYGGFEIELNSAVWTGTIQTFMQLPVSATQPWRIRREDECRLAYLASKDYQHNLPLFPWKPFGTVDLKDAELDVQIHAGCHGHGLRYRGWAWDCVDNGRPVRALHQPPSSSDTGHELLASVPHLSVEVPYDMLDLDDDAASCTATLNIFMWLRRTGFAASEQHIRRHEWLCEVLDDEEEEAYESWPEDELEDDSAIARAQKKRSKSAVARPKLGRWLASTQTKRGNSI
jgi:hypothetical protein